MQKDYLCQPVFLQNTQTIDDEPLITDGLCQLELEPFQHIGGGKQNKRKHDDPKSKTAQEGNRHKTGDNTDKSNDNGDPKSDLFRCTQLHLHFSISSDDFPLQMHQPYGSTIRENHSVDN